jgi:ATP-dependent RNA helicase RhlE
MPQIPEDYIHRIGRTGRAGVSGIAISLVSPEERTHLKAIEALLKQKIPMEEVRGFTIGGAVPDFVLLRPNNPSSEKKADKAIREIVDQRKITKQRGKAATAKTDRTKTDRGKTSGGKTPDGKTKPRSVRNNKKAGKNASRTGSRSPQSSKKGNPRGRR